MKARKKKVLVERTELKVWRYEKGLNQSALAQKLGVGLQTVSRIERGHAPRDGSVVLKLEEITGIDRKVLFPEVYRRAAREV